MQTPALSAGSYKSWSVYVYDPGNRQRAHTVLDLFRLTINVPTLPDLRLTGLPATADPASQPQFQLSLASPFPVALSGQLVLTFCSGFRRRRIAPFSSPAADVLLHSLSQPGITAAVFRRHWRYRLVRSRAPFVLQFSSRHPIST